MPRPNWIDDQQSIPDAAVLWRGVTDPEEIRQKNSVDIPSQGSLITHELSVSVGAETNPAAFRAKGLAVGAVWRIWTFTAQQVRAAGCIVDREPQANDASHCLVLRADAPGARLRGASATYLINHGAWLIEPPAGGS